jgi:hypothetical protein
MGEWLQRSPIAFTSCSPIACTFRHGPFMCRFISKAEILSSITLKCARQVPASGDLQIDLADFNLTLPVVQLLFQLLSYSEIFPIVTIHRSQYPTMLSTRGLQNAKELDVPWRFPPTQTYDPETNPTGMISFGIAENVSTSLRNTYINRTLIPCRNQ